MCTSATKWNHLNNFARRPPKDYSCSFIKSGQAVDLVVSENVFESSIFKTYFLTLLTTYATNNFGKFIPVKLSQNQVAVSETADYM